MPNRGNQLRNVTYREEETNSYDDTIANTDWKGLNGRHCNCGYSGNEKDEDEKKEMRRYRIPKFAQYLYANFCNIADCNMQDDGALIAVGFSTLITTISR